MRPYRSFQCCVLVALAALQLASARPDKSDNLIPVEEKKEKTSHAKTKPPIDPKLSTKIFTAADKPVNEQYPSAVLFERTCGGTIIGPTWILTAGHCTLSMIGRYVLAGTNNTANGSGVQRRVKRLVIHPLFTVGPYWLDPYEFNIQQVAAHWDFLLAELEEPLPLDGKTIAVAPLNEEVSLPSGQEVGFAGFGTDHHGGTMSHEMHAKELLVQANDVCKTALVEFSAEDMVCTKGRPPNNDTACNGDSGSGLVDAQGRLVGVASWVEDDARECRNGALVVFSRVSAVRDWIRQVTKI